MNASPTLTLLPVLIGLALGYFGLWLHEDADRDRLTLKEWLDQRAIGFALVLVGWPVAGTAIFVWFII